MPDALSFKALVPNIDDRILLVRRMIWIAVCCLIAVALYGLYLVMAPRQFIGRQGDAADAFAILWVLLCAVARVPIALLRVESLASVIGNEREFQHDSGVRAHQAKPTGLIDRVFVALANLFVLVLLSVYAIGYFLMAQKAHFAGPIVLLFVGISMTSVFVGSITRIFVVPRTLLAYGMIFTGGMLVTGGVFTALEMNGTLSSLSMNWNTSTGGQ